MPPGSAVQASETRIRTLTTIDSGGSPPAGRTHRRCRLPAPLNRSGHEFIGEMEQDSQSGAEKSLIGGLFNAIGFKRRWARQPPTRLDRQQARSTGQQSATGRPFTGPPVVHLGWNLEVDGSRRGDMGPGDSGCRSLRGAKNRRR